MLLPGLIDGFLFERPCRIAAAKVQSLCGVDNRLTAILGSRHDRVLLIASTAAHLRDRRL
jgi:hypothetical protein